jgi:enoyl-CoA hydratase/carnithine racemase
MTETSQDILTETVDGVRIVTLNRPHRLNAFSKEQLQGLSRALDEIEEDADSHVMVITGSPRPDGRPCFCAGADLKELAKGGAASMGERDYDLARDVAGLVMGDYLGASGVRALQARMETFPKILIAAIDGVCTAGGLEIAMSCDIRVVAETAQISDLHVKNVFMTGGGGATSMLTRLIGPSKAKELILLGMTIDGVEAHRIGLANRVVPSSELMKETLAIAVEIGKRNPLAIRMVKAIANAVQDLDREHVARYDYLCRSAQMTLAGRGYEGARHFAATHG